MIEKKNEKKTKKKKTKKKNSTICVLHIMSTLLISQILQQTLKFRHQIVIVFEKKYLVFSLTLFTLQVIKL